VQGEAGVVPQGVATSTRSQGSAAPPDRPRHERRRCAHLAIKGTGRQAQGTGRAGPVHRNGGQRPRLARRRPAEDARRHRDLPPPAVETAMTAATENLRAVRPAARGGWVGVVLVVALWTVAHIGCHGNDDSELSVTPPVSESTAEPSRGP